MLLRNLVGVYTNYVVLLGSCDLNKGRVSWIRRCNYVPTGYSKNSWSAVRKMRRRVSHVRNEAGVWGVPL